MMDGGRGPILVGVGNRGVGDHSVTYATTEAQRADCGVHLVHVVPRTDLIGIAEQSRLRRVGEYRLDVASQVVRARSSGRVKVTSELMEGEAVDVLIDRSARSRMVVVERPSMVVLDKVAAPSVSRGLAMHSAAPVVSVPANWRGEGASPDNVVTVVLDRPHGSRSAIAAGMAAARALDARLEFVHTWWCADGGGRDSFDAADAEDGAESYISAKTAADIVVAASARSELIVISRFEEADEEVSLSAATIAALYRSSCPVLMVSASHPTDAIAYRRSLRLASGGAK